jgi:hypothetical protein
VKLGVWWKAHQQIAGARSDGHVLRLTVHQQRRPDVSERAKGTRKPLWISMPPFEGLHDARG